jgi:ABC-type multidrug transport system permease subunit
MGPRSESVAYFTKLGYKCPPETNAAEYFMDLVTVDTEDSDQAILDKDRIDLLIKAFRQQTHALETNENNWYESPPNIKLQGKTRLSRPPFFARFGALLRRSLRQNLRDVKVNSLRGSASLILARLFSELFKSVKHGMPLAKGVADRTALLSFGVINMSMLALMKSLNLFGKEKKVVNREKMKRQYTSIEYLLSKALAELPLDATFSVLFASALKHFTFLNTTFGKLCGTFALMTVAGASLGYAVGSMTTGVEEAMTVGMPIMVVFMAVGVINPSGVDPKAKIPWIVQCLKRLSPVGIAIEALCIAEYKGLDFGSQGTRFRVADLPKMGGLALVRNGDQVLGALGLSGQQYSSKMLDLGKLSGFFLLTSLVGLKLSEPNRRVDTNLGNPPN